MPLDVRYQKLAQGGYVNLGERQFVADRVAEATKARAEIQSAPDDIRCAPFWSRSTGS